MTAESAAELSPQVGGDSSYLPLLKAVPAQPRCSQLASPHQSHGHLDAALAEGRAAEQSSQRTLTREHRLLLPKKAAENKH